MKKIEDTGKIWRPGRFKPEPAVRVGDQVFILGQEEGESGHCLAARDALLVDLHDVKNRRRRALRFPYHLQPRQKATLFNGFTRTPHGDVGVIAADDPGVEEVVVEAEAYSRAGASELAPEGFFSLAGWIAGLDQ